VQAGPAWRHPKHASASTSNRVTTEKPARPAKVNNANSVPKSRLRSTHPSRKS
jgi:hypothetical protein